MGSTLPAMDPPYGGKGTAALNGTDTDGPGWRESGSTSGRDEQNCLTGRKQMQARVRLRPSSTSGRQRQYATPGCPGQAAIRCRSNAGGDAPCLAATTASASACTHTGATPGALCPAWRLPPPPATPCGALRPRRQHGRSIGAIQSHPGGTVRSPGLGALSLATPRPHPRIRAACGTSSARRSPTAPPPSAGCRASPGVRPRWPPARSRPSSCRG